MEFGIVEGGELDRGSDGEDLVLAVAKTELGEQALAVLLDRAGRAEHGGDDREPGDLRYEVTDIPGRTLLQSIQERVREQDRGGDPGEADHLHRQQDRELGGTRLTGESHGGGDQPAQRRRVAVAVRSREVEHRRAPPGRGCGQAGGRRAQRTARIAAGSPRACVSQRPG